jgi:hypothetical protein
MTNLNEKIIGYSGGQSKELRMLGMIVAEAAKGKSVMVLSVHKRSQDRLFRQIAGMTGFLPIKSLRADQIVFQNGAVIGFCISIAAPEKLKGFDGVEVA